MGLGSSGGIDDDDYDDEEEDGIPPEQTTVDDHEGDSGSGTAAAGAAAGAGAASGGGAAAGGAATAGTGNPSVDGEGEDPKEETESENDEAPEQQPPEESETEPEQENTSDEQQPDNQEPDVKESEEEDDEQEAQEAELTVYTDAWDVTGWGIEPVLKKLEQDFGISFDLSYELLSPREFEVEDWNKASSRYAMPYAQVVDLPDDTKISTSALHAARELDQDLFRDYLRRLRIAALVEGRDIEDRGLLIELADEAGYDTTKFNERWYGNIDDIGQYDTTPKMWATVGDHEIPWQGNLEYELAFGVLMDNNVLPVGSPSSYDQLVEEYEPITSKEISVIKGDADAETKLDQVAGVVPSQYGDETFWEQA